MNGGDEKDARRTVHHTETAHAPDRHASGRMLFTVRSLSASWPSTSDS